MVIEGWTADQIPDQTGRSYVVTGGNSGLGYETVRALARHGATVVMTVRDEAKGRAALASLGHPSHVRVRLLDLADLDSVREFAGQLIAERVPVDVLVNNAGVMMPPRTLTPQGFELQFATNHLGHFALTGLLLPTLRAAREPRVVTVSSGLHRGGKIYFDDLTGARSYSPVRFYSQSKFANVLFALELDRRLRAAGEPMRSVVTHPGYAATNLQTTGPAKILRPFGQLGNLLFAQSAADGALSQLYAATMPDVEGGQFLGPGRLREMRGHPKLVPPDPKATDPETARRLWEVSEELTGVRYPVGGESRAVTAENEP
jgi:NAD(P)-dependent dehydrogenase (short-subunit alcohol dehydrogenase family)